MTVDEIIERAESVAFGKVQNELHMLAVALGAIILAISLLKIANDYINAEGGNLFSLLKPVIIFLCLCVYPAVSSVVVNMTSVFTREITSRVDISVEDVWKNVNKVGYNTDNHFANERDKMIEESQKKLDEQVGAINRVSSWFDHIGCVIKEYGKYIGAGFSLGFSQLAFTALTLLVKAWTFIMMVTSGVYLSILTVFGCFMFAIAILPNYSNGIHNWISRYVQISLWTPMCYIILAIANGIFLSIGDSDLATSIASHWMSLCYMLILLFALMNVPNMAGWFIESTGANRVHSDMGSGAKALGRKYFLKR